MMQMSKRYLSDNIKKNLIGIALFMLKPFIVPIIIIIIFIIIISSITDILYIAFDNDDKINMKEELKYYDTEYDKQKDKGEVKGFFSSVWQFVDKITGGGGMSTETDWPVERIL